MLSVWPSRREFTPNLGTSILLAFVLQLLLTICRGDVEHLKNYPGVKYQGFDTLLAALLFMINKEPYRTAAQLAGPPAERIVPGSPSSGLSASIGHTVPTATFASGPPGARYVCAPVVPQSASTFNRVKTEHTTYGRAMGSASAGPSPVKIAGSGAGSSKAKVKEDPNMESLSMCK